MFSLEISSIGSACGKNPYVPRNRTLFAQICKCKSQKNMYKRMFFERGIFETENIISKDKNFKSIYDKYKSEIKNPSHFNNIEEKVVQEFKKVEPDVDTDKLVKSLKEDLKKDCGKNNEEMVINKKKFKKGNDKIYKWTNLDNGWEIKGFHDASENDIVIEIKTRMRSNTVRKNEYDLYQLFGYMLAMNKTKGKIVQLFDGNIYDSNTETDKEYGIVNITDEYWKKKYDLFLYELDNFFKELSVFKTDVFDIKSLFQNFEMPIAKFDIDELCFNVTPEFEKIVKLLC